MVFPPSTWDREEVIKSIKKNKDPKNNLRFISDCFICIGRRENENFKPSEFLKTILLKEIPFKIHWDNKCDRYKSNLEKGGYYYEKKLHFWVGKKGAAYHFHLNDNKREYFYTNSPYYKSLLKSMFNKEWNDNEHNQEVKLDNFQKFEEQRVLIVEIGQEEKYKQASQKEIEKFKEFVNLNNITNNITI